MAVRTHTGPAAHRANLALLSRVRGNALILVVLACFALTALIVPVMVPAGVGDDWVYVRSVEILLREGQLRILDLSVVTLVFQVAWGALFAAVFGLDFGVLRLSTVVMTLVGAAACYGLCRELQVARMPSALATAAYLFHPLSFALAYTFMTDPHFTALLLLATYGYVKGLRVDFPDRRALLLGASVAACAFLVRQQGALIAPAVLFALLLQRRLRPDRASLLLAVRIVAIPAAAIVGYYLWLLVVHGVPREQTSFTNKVVTAGWEQSALLIARMTFVDAMYVGLFTLPVALAALGAIPLLVRVRSPWAWSALLAWTLMLTIGLLHFDGRLGPPPPMPRMPYIPQYLGPYGLGPTDLLGGRAWLLSWPALDVLTALCLAAALLFALLLARQIARPALPDPSRRSAGIVLLVALGQVAGIVLPSFHFRNWIVSVDRYLLPLLPLSLCLAVWALRRVRPAWGAAWVVVVLGALIGVAGTRDLLAFQDATWEVARSALAEGVPVTALDAGAAWDGYHLYEYSVAHDLDQQTPGGPWWTDLFAPATTSEYVVSTTPLDGHQEVRRQELDTWLDGRRTVLHVLRQIEAVG